MRKIKITDLLEAAKKNGYAWSGYGEHSNMPVRYCILEQAALNLRDEEYPDYLGWVPLDDALNKLNSSLGVKIWGYNDTKAVNYEDAFQNMEMVLTSYMDKELEIDPEIDYMK